MRLLLDTHIALWAITDSPRLSGKARDLIADPSNWVFVSSASLWEIAIKHRLARGTAHDMPVSAAVALRHFRSSGYEIVDISYAHAVTTETLPPLHGDPFDRILIAQALTIPLRLLTADTKVASYSESIILA